MLADNAMSTAPSFSVIITCRDPGPRLHAALESLWLQRGAPIELILIDRGSTDGTREWLEARRSQITLVPSSADVGVFQALNEALAIARGDWIFFFGADDRLVGDAVLSETLNWMKKTECGVVAGESASDDGRISNLGAHANPIARDFVPCSATFYRRGLFEENGAFDPTAGAMARYELNLRLWKNRVRFKPIPLRIAATEPAAGFDWQSAREEIRVRHRYYPGWRCWRWDAMSMLRAIRPGRSERKSER
jgi:putative colanic acid biosynthesis glycosyltransferase